MKKVRKIHLLDLFYFHYLVITCLVSINSYGQCLTHKQFWDSLISIENSNFNPGIKLENLNSLRAQYEKCSYEKDSVYARMLHKTGLWEYIALSQIEDAINKTVDAVRINTSNERYACP